jgi:beta-galactosidase
MKLGVCYYPEQWPPERWPIDARMMREAGLSLVRLADFAWSLLEPREDQYNFAWLDQAIETLAGEGLQIILCTPTASPPPWLCRAYPEILPLDARGSRLRQGGRRHYCPNSSTYQRLTEKIVAALASHYGQNPAVVAWQIDNELGWAGTSRCYCETCTRAFHDWLKKRYRTIATLNEAWGTVFWSQIYNDWCEIDLPNLIVGKPNPSHTLDFERFCSDSIAAYQQLQIDTLKESIAAHQKITTNFMSQFSDLDYYDLARPLDFVSMSSYPTGQAEARSALYPVDSHLPKFAHDSGDPYVTSFWHALMRGYLPKRPYWVMEQQCGRNCRIFPLEGRAIWAGATSLRLIAP